MFFRYFLLLSFAFCKGRFYENDPFDPYGECPDIEFKDICTDQCEVYTLDCILNCPSDNTSCISNCLREDTECIDNCPCEVNCQEGCTDCPNPVCECKDVKENEEWNRCRRANGEILTLCIYECSDNKSCEDQCLADYKIRQADCPCEANCPAGCPCINFDCSETTTSADVSTSTAPVTATTSTSTTAPVDPNAVLVLSTKNANNKPMVVTFDGVVNDNLDFKYGSETVARNGCSVTLHGQFWYLGGYPDKRQSCKIIGCELVRQADLPFDFDRGSCNTFQAPDEKALMCFDLSSTKVCRIFDGVGFTSAAPTKCYHQWGGLANYKGLAFTTGSDYNSGCYKRSELYNFDTNQWTDAPNYPFASKIYQYSVASTEHAAFIIGGRDRNSNAIDIIAKFQDNEWTQYGSLKAARYVHGSITSTEQTMIMGGESSVVLSLPTEVWNFTNGDNKLIQPTLSKDQYAIGIGLYLVDPNFCKKQ